jgi:hypothetical protein
MHVPMHYLDLIRLEREIRFESDAARRRLELRAIRDACANGPLDGLAARLGGLLERFGKRDIAASLRERFTNPCRQPATSA